MYAFTGFGHYCGLTNLRHSELSQNNLSNHINMPMWQIIHLAGTNGRVSVKVTQSSQSQASKQHLDSVGRIRSHWVCLRIHQGRSGYLNTKWNEPMTQQIQQVLVLKIVLDCVSKVSLLLSSNEQVIETIETVYMGNPCPFKDSMLTDFMENPCPFKESMKIDGYRSTILNFLKIHFLKKQF